MGDRQAVTEVELGDLIGNLPGSFCAIGDCAYTPSNHLVPVYGGASAKIARNDTFNFYASQLRIRIEMAFGLMTKKWGILHRPLQNDLKHLKHLVVAIGRLHNYGINERLAQRPPGHTFKTREVSMDPTTQAMRTAQALFDFDEMQGIFESGHSETRGWMVDKIESMKISRPSTNRK